MKWKLIVLSVAVAAMTACNGGDGGSDDYAARLRGETGAVAPTLRPTASMQAPTETPDLPPTALGIVEATRINEAPVVQQLAQPIVVTATPQPAMSPAACDARTPAPTMALDAADIAAGVVVRGVWPCYEVQP